MRPKVYDLFCGLGGWSEGFLAEGYECIGFDIEAHDYGSGGYPGELILRDIRSIHGSELKDATCIVASPPCQAYSYRAMPWKRAKALPSPDNTLFNECFRIQREASAAAGYHIPLIVENVRGAQKWVGRAVWNYGSFFLWGDVPALMPIAMKATKNTGGSWFAVAHNTTSGHGNNPVSIVSDGQKLPGNNAPRMWSERRVQRLADGLRHDEDSFYCASSGSKSRKAASAMIAKIPFPLSSHIARCFKPHLVEKAEVA
jgi:hypothetical protein